MPALRSGLARLAVAFLSLAVTGRADRVEWSDGEVWEGRLQTSGEGGLRFHDGQQLRTWSLDELVAIAFRPATQTMERAWRFIEAGKTAKEFTGGTYPVAELLAEATLRDGRVVPGHLITTVFYLEDETQTRKVVVKHKLRGKEGETPADLLYPQRLLRSDVPKSGRPTCRVTLAGGVSPDAELAVVLRAPVTAAAAVRREGGGFAFDVEGTDPVLAVRDGPRIAVGWAGGASDALRVRLAASLPDMRDFFDRRTVLATASNAVDGAVAYTLVLMSREGRTTMGGAQTQPWRLEVWRWRLGDDGHNLLAARAVLFRGIVGRDEALPDVRLAPELVRGALDALITLTVDTSDGQSQALPSTQSP